MDVRVGKSTDIRNLRSVIVSLPRIFLSHEGGGASMQIFFADNTTASYFFHPDDGYEVLGFSLPSGDFVVYEKLSG